MTPYNAASFSTTALDTLIRRGEQEARGRWDEIMALKRRSVSRKIIARRNIHYPVSHIRFYLPTVFISGISLLPVPTRAMRSG